MHDHKGWREPNLSPTNTKRQHYVPQLLLRRFATDDIIRVFDLDESREYRTSVINTAVESRFYDEEFGDIHGRLYTWHAAQTACPAGWHTSRDSDWKELEMYLGMSQDEANNTDYRGTDEGEKLKSLAGWEEGTNGTDVVGFTAIPPKDWQNTCT